MNKYIEINHYTNGYYSNKDHVKSPDIITKRIYLCKALVNVDNVTYIGAYNFQYNDVTLDLEKITSYIVQFIDEHDYIITDEEGYNILKNALIENREESI
ncbi:MAG: hypothetical protein IJH39_04440 [Clostridia bacterium]|nr:hypothetical protein [Clostridia bacterium]